MRAAARSNEWPLVFFTVLTQAAAGAAVAGFGIAWALAPERGIERLTSPVPISAIGLLIVGGIAATLHLGRKSHARFALANLQNSWLSREALLVKAFGALLGAWVFVGGNTVALFAAVVGLVLVLAISSLYRLRTVPAWDTWATPASFLATTAILGSATVAVVIGERGAWSGVGSPATLASLEATGLLAAAATIAQIAILALHLRRLRATGGAASASATVIVSRHREILVARLLLALLGAAQILRATWPTGGPYCTLGITAGAALLFASEILGRYLFYAAHRRVGL